MAAKASAVISIAAQKNTTCFGSGVVVAARRRLGNARAHHPKIIAIAPLDARQAIVVGVSHNAKSGGRIEANVVINPS